MSRHLELPPERPVSPVLVRSTNAFYRDLPELLKTRSSMWVAYHGDRCVGSARTETELYQRCTREGIPEDEFIVLFADPHALSDREPIELPTDR